MWIPPPLICETFPVILAAAHDAGVVVQVHAGAVAARRVVTHHVVHEDALHVGDPNAAAAVSGVVPLDQVVLDDARRSRRSGCHRRRRRSRFADEVVGQHLHRALVDVDAAPVVDRGVAGDGVVAERDDVARDVDPAARPARRCWLMKVLPSTRASAMTKSPPPCSSAGVGRRRRRSAGWRASRPRPPARRHERRLLLVKLVPDHDGGAVDDQAAAAFRPAAVAVERAVGEADLAAAGVEGRHRRRSALLPWTVTPNSLQNAPVAANDRHPGPPSCRPVRSARPGPRCSRR